MTAKNFAPALRFTLGEEGGWADNRHDPGGCTMHGCTLRTFRIYYPGSTAQDLRNAPMGKFEQIYHKDFWLKIGADALPSGVDVLAFDIAVNAGPGRVSPWLAQTAHLAPAARVKALDAKRRGFWRVLKIFRTFGVGWFRRENACEKLALSLI